MHDLPDAYSKTIIAATQRANEARYDAHTAFENRMDEINTELQAVIAEAGTALEAGLVSRMRTFRGENQESEVMPSASEVSGHHRNETAPGDAEPERHVAGGATPLVDYEIKVLRFYADTTGKIVIETDAALNAATEELRERGLIDRSCCVTSAGAALLQALDDRSANAEQDRRFLEGLPTDAGILIPDSGGGVQGASSI